MPKILVKPTEWQKRIENFIRPKFSEAFVDFEVRKIVPMFEEFRDKVLSIIKRDVDAKHLGAEAEEIERNFRGKGKEFLIWAKATLDINLLKEDEDFLKEVKEWHEKLIRKMRKQ